MRNSYKIIIGVHLSVICLDIKQLRDIDSHLAEKQEIK